VAESYVNIKSKENAYTTVVGSRKGWGFVRCLTFNASREAFYWTEFFISCWPWCSMQWLMHLRNPLTHHRSQSGWNLNPSVIWRIKFDAMWCIRWDCSRRTSDRPRVASMKL